MTLTSHWKTVAVALALALTLAACGSSSSSEAKSAVKSYLKAFATGDGKAACSLMAEETRAQFVRQAKPLTHTSDCRKAVAALKPALSRAFKGIHVSSAKVAGGEAVVNITAGSRASPALLRKEGGKWKISAAPGTQ